VPSSGRRASPAMADALVEAALRTDVRSLLPEVAVPTLVLHRRGDLIDVEQSRYIAAHVLARSTWSSTKTTTCPGSAIPMQVSPASVTLLCRWWRG
jgi:hypothetical protein